MPFNTAIFYDIENLLKGYSFSQQVVANLSLKEIVDAMKGTSCLEMATNHRQRAMRWSRPG
jgi:hypothetical protein